MPEPLDHITSQPSAARDIEEEHSPFEVLAPLDADISLDLRLSISTTSVDPDSTSPTTKSFYHSQNSSAEHLSLNVCRQTFGGPKHDGHVEGVGLVASMAQVFDGKTTHEAGPRIVEQRSKPGTDPHTDDSQEPKRQGRVWPEHSRFKNDETYDLLCSSPPRSPTTWYSADDAGLSPPPEPNRKMPDPRPAMIKEEYGTFHQTFDEPRASPAQSALLGELLHRAPTDQEQLALWRVLKYNTSINRSESWDAITSAAGSKEARRPSYANKSRSEPGIVGLAWEEDDGGSNSVPELDEYHALLCQQRGLSRPSFKPSFRRFFGRD
ncbi:hypothetical protein NM208_g6288 [Fusarium decemcellulare]|uniref:Uncharacterized protein n=1 Tax=Fusarium decemcellulare TaxID=57161 RepID=A0ACC1SDT3_9HYPO|nr:hypothetical protein NM208_g6288 [Fusarium decemcellulare]